MVVLGAFLLSLFTFSTCKYGFKDVAPLSPDIKTFRVNYLENKATYVNPQLSPQLTEKLKQKIINLTRLRPVQDDPDYDISGYVSQYYVLTQGVSNNTTTTNRLTVVFHLEFKNHKDEKKNISADITRLIDVPANLLPSQIDNQKTTNIVTDLSDEIFNKIFSNW